MNAGEVVVMDIGASYRGYAADVTRTVPISGTFTPDQRAIYQIVRDAQAAAFSAAVESLAARCAPVGLALEVTGPWPPYNFVGLDLSRDVSAAAGGAR